MSQSAIDTTRQIGVVLGRRSLDNPWIDHMWVAQTLLYPAPEAEPGALLSKDETLALVYAGPATIELFVSETSNYRDNLLSGAPGLWVAARSRSDGGTPEFVRVTADPTEGEAYFESGSDIVAALPIPAELNAWISAFVDEYHVERVFLKRKRDGKGGKERGGQRGGGS